MPPSSLARLRKICLSFPEAREVVAWGTATFRAKTIFAMYASAATHHGDGRAGVWVKAVVTNQQLLLGMDPDRFFYPPYTGPAGWIGVYLDHDLTDWDELRDLLWDGWCMSAPPKLVAQHPEPPPLRRSTNKPKSKQSNAKPKKRAPAKRGKRARKV